MTFDTFDSYNTDEAYKDKGTTAKGLVEAYKKDNPEGTKDDFYAKLNKTWAQDKDGHVKNAVEEAFKVTPKKEEVKEEVKETEKPAEPFKENETPETTSKISQKDETFMEGQNAISETQEDAENNRQKELEHQRWLATNDRMQKSGEAFGKIDDKLVAQLPTFMLKRYADGEFGDPKSSDAKLRLAHFMINGIQSKLKTASNLAAINAGRSPVFADTTSDYEKYQQTNLGQGLENRWNKYKQETQTAIDLAKEQGEDEQQLQSSIAKISSNNRLQSAFNMMNENEKVYTLRVLSKIGNEIGSMSNKDFVNTLIGYATSGDNLTWQEAAELLVARFGKDALGAIKDANADGVTEGAQESTAGFGGTTTKTTLSDGTEITTSGKLGGMTDDDYDKLESKATQLIKDYYSGKIDKTTFEKDYGALYNMMQSHKIYNKKKTIKSIKDIYKENKPYEAKEVFGEKSYKDGIKSIEYFEKDPKLFEYFKNAESPNYLDAKAESKNIKDMKAYNKALEYYNRLKNTKDGKGLTLVGKW